MAEERVVLNVKVEDESESRPTDPPESHDSDRPDDQPSKPESPSFRTKEAKEAYGRIRDAIMGKFKGKGAKVHGDPPPSDGPGDEEEEGKDRFPVEDTVEAVARSLGRSFQQGAGVKGTVRSAIRSGVGGAILGSGGSAAVLAPLAAAAGAAAVSIWGLAEASRQAADAMAFSPQVAAAGAIAERRETLGRIRRANAAAPELSEFVGVRSEISEQLADIKNVMIQQLLPNLTGSLQVLNDLLGGINAVVQFYNTAEEFSQAVGVKVLTDLGFSREWSKRIVAFLDGPLAAYLEARNDDKEEERAKFLQGVDDFLGPEGPFLTDRGVEL